MVCKEHGHGGCPPCTGMAHSSVLLRHWAPPWHHTDPSVARPGLVLALFTYSTNPTLLVLSTVPAPRPSPCPSLCLAHVHHRVQLCVQPMSITASISVSISVSSLCPAPRCPGSGPRSRSSSLSSPPRLAHPASDRLFLFPFSPLLLVFFWFFLNCFGVYWCYFLPPRAPTQANTSAPPSPHE